MKRHLLRAAAAILCLAMVAAPVPAAAEEKSNAAYAGDFLTIMDYIESSYLKEIDRQVLFEAAMEGMFSQLDAYSAYIGAEDSEDFMNTINNAYVGIGVVLVQQGDFVMIERVFLSGPADRAGVAPGDLVVAIGEEDARGFTIGDVQKRLLGEEGTAVEVAFNRDGAVYEVALSRESIVLKSVEAFDIGSVLANVAPEVEEVASYVRLETFSSQAAKELEAVVLMERLKGTTHLVLDLRGNGGGYVDAGIQVLNQLVEAGPVVRFTNKLGRTFVFESHLQQAPFELVVLVDGGTASTSEFVAAAIQESGQGLLVGETTYGKGVAQNVLELEDGAMVKLTTEEFFTGEGRTINGVGITPDVESALPKYVDTARRLYLLDNGEDVQAAEEALAYLGYDPGARDGLYDRNTYNAVKQFQADKGLYPYGVCDFTTQKEINALLLELLSSRDVQLEKAYEVLLDLMDN